MKQLTSQQNSKGAHLTGEKFVDVDLDCEVGFMKSLMDVPITFVLIVYSTKRCSAFRGRYHHKLFHYSVHFKAVRQDGAWAGTIFICFYIEVTYPAK